MHPMHLLYVRTWVCMYIAGLSVPSWVKSSQTVSDFNDWQTFKDSKDFKLFDFDFPRMKLPGHFGSAFVSRSRMACMPQLHFPSFCSLYIVLCFSQILTVVTFEIFTNAAFRSQDSHHSPVEIGPRVCPVAPVFHFAIHWTSDLSAGPASRLIACSEVKTHSLSSCDSCDSCDLKSRICTL